MAKRRKKSTSRRRRGSVGAVKGGDMMFIGALTLGAVAGRLVTSRFLSTMNPKISSAVQIAGGMFIPTLIKSNFGKGIGYGMATNGAVNLLQSFNVIGQIDDSVQVDYVGALEPISGIENEIAGIEDMDSMAGVDDVVAGFERESGMYNIGADDESDM